MSQTGVVKSFNDGKGWGFITMEGTDVFVHVKDCKDGRPQQGDAVSFDLDEDKVRAGQHKAINITGCTGTGDGKGKGKGGAGTGTCAGVVKSFNDTKGWGFVDMGGTDVFLHVKDCQGGRPVVGDYLTFDVEDSGRGNGQQKACNVSGCSGFSQKGYGKGDGYGAMYGGGYGGFGGGFGKGYGGCGPYGGKGFGGYDAYGFGGKGW